MSPAAEDLQWLVAAAASCRAEAAAKKMKLPIRGFSSRTALTAGRAADRFEREAREIACRLITQGMQP